MHRPVLIVFLVSAIAFLLFYAAYGQSKEVVDKLKESERYIELLKKVEDAIAAIETDRKLPREMKIIDVADLLLRIPDYAPPSPFVYDVESSGRRPEERAIFPGREEEPFERAAFTSDQLTDTLKQRTGEDNWPELGDGFGTIHLHRGKLIVINTPEMVSNVEAIVNDFRKNLPPLISSAVYLLAADEEYLSGLREKGSSIVSPEAIKKMLNDVQPGSKVELLRTGYLTAYSSQAAYLYCGTVQTYQGDTDTSGMSGLVPIEIFDPIINVFREGLIVGLRAQFNRQTNQTNLVAMVGLSKLIAIEEHKAIGGGFAKEKEGGVTGCKVETPKVDLQIVSGSADVPAGSGLLLGGSRMKTAQAQQKSFVVLVVPTVQK